MPKKFDSTSINNPRCQPQTTFSSIIALKHWPKDTPIKEENTLSTTLMSLMYFQDFKLFCWRLLSVTWKDNCTYISAAKNLILFSVEKRNLITYFSRILDTPKYHTTFCGIPGCLLGLGQINFDLASSTCGRAVTAYFAPWGRGGLAQLY